MLFKRARLALLRLARHMNTRAQSMRARVDMQRNLRTNPLARGIQKKRKIAMRGSDPNRGASSDLEYESLSKILHRQRIADDVNTDGGHALLFLASPNGEDSAYFAESVPAHVRLHAVNRSSIQCSARVRRRVTLHEGIELAGVLNNAPKSFSHVWCDTTNVDMDPNLLQDAIRSATHKVYVVLNTSRCIGGFAEARERLAVRAQFFNARIAHQEEYAGAGGKRSMLFVVLDVTKQKCDRESHPCIGKPVWTEVTKSTGTTDNYAYVRENGKFYYTGRVVDVDSTTGKFGVQYYDTHMRLAQTSTTMPARGGHVSVRKTVKKPLIEWLEMKDVLAHMGKRRGDA